MRELTNHKVNECNNQIHVLPDAMGAGGAPVRYDVVGPEVDNGPAGTIPAFAINIKFQDGPIADGVNGLTHEVLLAIIEDRLVGFQTGKFANKRNASALVHIRAAQEELKNLAGIATETRGGIRFCQIWKVVSRLTVASVM